MSAVKVRDSARNAIKRYMRVSEQTDTLLDKERAEAYTILLNEQWERFKEAQHQLDVVAGADGQHIEEEERSQTETWYVKGVSYLKRILRKEPSAITQSNAAAAGSTRLPQMDLPTFSGKPIDWISFRNIYLTLIHNNISLSDGQKMHYLRSCLKGDALKVVNQSQITDANYLKAWAMIEERFHVARILIDHYLAAMNLIKRASVDSASAIRNVLDSVLQHICALRALSRPVEFWDDWIVHLVLSKLTIDTRKEWELSIRHQVPPTFEELQDFLTARCRSLESLGTRGSNERLSTSVLHVLDSNYTAALQNEKPGRLHRCSHCKADHKIYTCEGFNQLSPADRRESIKRSGSCFNCLNSGHLLSECKSAHSCKLYKQRHHTLLHPASPILRHSARHERSPVTFYKTTQNSASGDLVRQSLTSSTILTSHILIATAHARARDSSGRWQPVRILLDNGSHISLISEDCMQRLGIAKRYTSVVLTGVGNAVGGVARGKSMIEISPLGIDSSIRIDALVMSKITNNIPATDACVGNWPHVENLSLADPQFAISAPIDVLIGMDEMEKFVKPEMTMGAAGSPMAQLTIFGWALSGRIGNPYLQSYTISTLHCDTQLTTAVAELWELDQVMGRRHLTEEEMACEDHFASTHRRAADGRFIVELPFRKAVDLGESRQRAERSFVKMEKRLRNNGELRQEYNQFIEEMIDLNHVETASETNRSAYYMPHHFVVKESSTTTKLRVVFNASMKTSSGHSLNYVLLVGPQLQQDLFSIIIRFRSHPYVMSADVEKMYRQVLVSDRHCDYQRILWRFDPSEQLKSYRLLRVTYGVASASYLAIKALQETALQSSCADESVRSTILQDLYVVNLLTGASSEEELLHLQRKISAVLAEGGFI